MGDSLKKEDLNNQITDVEWSCKLKPTIIPTSTVPTLSYKFYQDGIGVPLEELKPNKANSKYLINYQVFANGKDITEQTAATHNNQLKICNSPYCKEHHFYANIVGGTININKIIDQNSLNEYDFFNVNLMFAPITPWIGCSS